MVLIGIGEWDDFCFVFIKIKGKRDDGENMEVEECHRAIDKKTNTATAAFPNQQQDNITVNGNR